MKRFTGETSNGVYEVILIDNSLALQYVELGGEGSWQAQKTEYRIPTPDFFSIEHYMFGDIDTPEEDEEEPISCRVTEGADGESELTVKLTNLLTQESVEWTFTAERSYGPLFIDKWGTLLRDIMQDGVNLDGDDTETS